MYFKDNELVVCITDESDRGLASYLGAQYLSTKPSAVLRSSSIRVADCIYRFNELLESKRILDNIVFNVDGVLYTDADESLNQVVVAVTTLAAADIIKSIVLEQSINPEMVTVVVREPITMSARLDDYVRPLKGGVRITSTKGCTLGFLAYRQGKQVFITNSHCTNVPGGTESTVFAQPNATYWFYEVGTEIVDPQFSSLFGCPSGQLCRRSDSAVVEITNGSTAWSYLHATTGIGSLTINGEYHIAEEEHGPTSGELVRKIGSTTGHTIGEIIATCVTIYAQNINRTFLCQEVVRGGAIGPGDSGSPVFSGGPSGSTAILYGILWGGGSDGFVFSNMGQVESDLGSLTTGFLE